MYLVTALLGESAWTLTFQHPDKADLAFKALNSIGPSGGPALELEDDFGVKVSVRFPPKAVQRNDCSKSFDGQALLGLFQARAQGKLQAMAQKDPQLMFLNGGAGLIHAARGG